MCTFLCQSRKICMRGAQFFYRWDLKLTEFEYFGTKIRLPKFHDVCTTTIWLIGHFLDSKILDFTIFESSLQVNCRQTRSDTLIPAHSKFSPPNLIAPCYEYREYDLQLTSIAHSALPLIFNVIWSIWNSSRQFTFDNTKIFNQIV